MTVEFAPFAFYFACRNPLHFEEETLQGVKRVRFALENRGLAVELSPPSENLNLSESG
jgi:hypothetical protein